MQKIFRALALACAAVVLAAAPGCFRQVIQTVEVNIPQMKTDTGAGLVRQALGFFDTNTVLKIDTDINKHKAWVTFDSTRAARRNVEKTIALAGFDANDIPADAATRKKLPADCQ